MNRTVTFIKQLPTPKEYKGKEIVVGRLGVGDKCYEVTITPAVNEQLFVKLITSAEEAMRNTTKQASKIHEEGILHTCLEDRVHLFHIQEESSKKIILVSGQAVKTNYYKEGERTTYNYLIRNINNEKCN